MNDETDARDFRPHVPPEVNLPEVTVRAVLLGIFFGIVFGAANAYLGLKVGLTISTSIPVAVMTVAAFRLLRSRSGPSGILEANLSQTVGSASSSVASGVIFTLPALFLWQIEPGLLQMTLLALCGGLLGVLFMIPLRRFLIVKEHGKLPYPEGTACAEVLRASEAGGARARAVFGGLALGALFKLVVGGLKAVKGSVHVKVPFLPKGELGLEMSSALLGVGWILGPRVGAIMVGGGLLSWLVIIPAIAVWGGGLEQPLYPETEQLLRDMEPSKIWTRYVRYIGAGAVATGGLLTLLRSIPTMVESFQVGARQIRQRFTTGEEESKRTERDLSLGVVGIGVGILFLLMAGMPVVFGEALSAPLRVACALLVVIFAFFFVTVSSRIVGLVGVTSNPTSGMTIATLLASSSLFLLLGWTDMLGKAAAITVGCVVAIAASIAGDTSQDLKTGFLLGATPRRQQLGEIVGVLTSATFVCLTILLLSETFGFGTPELPAPQATLMKVVVEGVIDQSLPWTFVLIGVGIALAAEMLRIPSLPFAVGVYLPVSTMIPLFLGGVLRWILERKASNDSERTARRDVGVLLGSGFVGGEGIVGVGIAAVAFSLGHAPAGIGTGWAGGAADGVALLFFAGLVALLVRSALGARPLPTEEGR